MFAAIALISYFRDEILSGQIHVETHYSQGGILRWEFSRLPFVDREPIDAREVRVIVDRQNELTSLKARVAISDNNVVVEYRISEHLDHQST